MNRETRGMIIGMVFGDAYVNVRKRLNQGKYKYESSEMTIKHSIIQKDYCEFKAALLRKHLNRNFSVTIRNNVGPDNKYTQVGFSVSHPYFKQVKNWCYPRGIKTYTQQNLDMLTPEGIAIWFMDDGSYRVNVNKVGKITSVSTDIATMCSKEEAELIQNYFLEKYGIKFNIRFRKNSSLEKSFFMQANTKDSHCFCELIKPWIIPSMTYKISHVSDLDSHECRAPLKKCSKCENSIFDNRHGGLCSTCYSRRYYREMRRFKENRIPAKNGFYKKGDDIVQTNGN